MKVELHPYLTQTPVNLSTSKAQESCSSMEVMNSRILKCWCCNEPSCAPPQMLNRRTSAGDVQKAREKNVNSGSQAASIIAPVAACDVTCETQTGGTRIFGLQEGGEYLQRASCLGLLKRSFYDPNLVVLLAYDMASTIMVAHRAG